MEQKGAATLFITYSMADLYWPDLHRLLGTEGKSMAEKRKAINANPHIVTSYFCKRVRDWNKAFLQDSLNQKWSWLRYENQNRGTIHCHMMSKLSNDPDLIKLCSYVYYGREAQKKKDAGTDLDVDKLNELIQRGKEAEKKIIAYCDTLITTMNPFSEDQRQSFRASKGNNHPCASRIDELTEQELNEDYANLINTVQRHKNCTSYCRRYKKGKPYCRFGYPFDGEYLSTETTIDFNKKKDGSFVVELRTKRNDAIMNKHNRSQVQNFRANVDMQIVLDWAACVNYIAKYAAKAEKKSETIEEVLSKTIKKLSDDASIDKAFRSMMIATLGQRDKSHQEAIQLLLSHSMPLVECNKFEFLPICLSNTTKLTQLCNIFIVIYF